MKKNDRVTLTIECHHVSAGTVTRHPIDGTVLSVTRAGYIKVQFDTDLTDRNMQQYAGRTISHPMDIWNTSGSTLVVRG